MSIAAARDRSGTHGSTAEAAGGIRVITRLAFRALPVRLAQCLLFLTFTLGATAFAAERNNEASLRSQFSEIFSQNRLGRDISTPLPKGNKATLRRQFLETFSQIRLGQDISKTSLPKGWADQALIQPIYMQTGYWFVTFEKGTSVFRVYPYFDENEGKTFRSFSCVVLKVDSPTVSLEELVDAFEARRTGEPLRIVQYSVSYPDGETVVRVKLH